VKRYAYLKEFFEIIRRKFKNSIFILKTNASIGIFYITPSDTVTQSQNNNIFFLPLIGFPVTLSTNPGFNSHIRMALSFRWAFLPMAYFDIIVGPSQEGALWCNLGHGWRR
jgi:hypothetical protein